MRLPLPLLAEPRGPPPTAPSTKHIWHSPCNSEVTSEMFYRIFALTPKKRHILSMIKREVFKLQSSATMR